MLINGWKVKVNRHVLGDLARIMEKLAEGREWMMIAPVVVELDLTYEFEPYALMVDACARLFESYVHCAAHVFAIVVNEVLNLFAVLDEFDALSLSRSV